MNKKPAAENNGRDIRLKLTTYSIPQTQKNFTYLCSFCWRELPNNGTRFDGFGVCPPHLKLAETIVDLLRGHAANYFKSNLGGAK
jgi:cyclophilin family peptidyl-prolyl cis-trans isomerase